MNGAVSEHLLDVTHVDKAFVNGPVPIRALQDVSFSVVNGEFVCLIGPSGSGKSTLLRIIGGLIKADAGDVCIEGAKLTEPRTDVGFVFQSTNLMPWRTVLQNVLLPLEVQSGAVTDDDVRKASDLLNLMALDGFSTVYPKHLSGGMAQRVVLARSLMQQPKLLLMDEPFGALDALTRERMNIELLRVQQMQSITVLMVTHSIPEAVFLSDRVIVLSERPGRIIADIDIPLPHPRTIEMTASLEYGEITLKLRTLIGLTAMEPAPPIPWE